MRGANMKYLILILTLLFFSCSLLEPEEQEETISLLWIYSREASQIHSPYTLNGQQTLTIDGEVKYCIQCDWIKAVVKGDKLINYEYYRYDKHYFKEPDPDYTYTWRRK